MKPHQASNTPEFARNAVAVLRAEDLLRAHQGGDIDGLTDGLLQAQSDEPAAALMGLVMLADQAIRDAAQLRGQQTDFYLRALGSWILHHYSQQEPSDG